MQSLTIEKRIEEQIEDKPRFELDKTGPDVADHNGIKWIWLVCPHCGAHARFYPEFYAKVRGSDQFGLHQTDHHYLCKSDCCNDIVYVKFWEVDFDPDWAFEYETHYPIVSTSSSSSIPTIVDVSFREAGKCLNAGASIAAVVMCRRTIEAVIKDQGGAKHRSNLVAGIKELVADKTLPPSMGALSDLVRMVGNIGAHASEEEVQYVQAREMYALTKAMVEMLYVTPQRVNTIRQRMETERQLRQQRTSPTEYTAS